ncbi:MAG TPA: hypothetical protein VHN98_10490 [Acidimicrobiales bacterium]|nr:hypothetical protein [Acidimicrobiales bacterium]
MTTNPVGEAFVHAVAAKDREALQALLGPDIDFRAMTPNRFWEADSPAAVVDDVILGRWFEEQDRIDGVIAIDHDRVADRDRVGYRLSVVTPDGRFVVEQQAYYGVDEGRITWLRIMCSGFREAA